MVNYGFKFPSVAGPRRWILVWLVLVFAVGVLKSQVQSGTLTHTAMTLSWSLSGGSIVVNWTITGATGTVGYTALLGTTSEIDQNVAFGGNYANASGTFSYGFNPQSDYYVQISNNGADNSDSERRKIYDGSSTKKITVKLFNSRDVPTTYKLLQNGALVGQVTLQPGTGLIQTFTVPDGTDVTVVEEVTGIMTDGTVWREVPGAVTSTNVGTLTPTPSTAGNDPPAVSVPQAPNVPNNVAPDKNPEDKSVWTNTPTNNDPAQQKDLLTNQTFREGIDKLYQLKKKETDRIEAALKANPTSTSAQGTAAASQSNALYAAATSTAAPTLNASSAIPTLAVTFPSAFGGRTIDFNPFTSERFAAVCLWFRTATAWLAVVLLGAWVWTQLGEWTRALSQVRQAQGNAVVGGTGAQATALIAAAAITVAIIACVTALLSWSFGEVGIAVIKSVTTQNPLVAIPAGVYWMLDQVLPVSTLLTCALARMTFSMYASPLYAACSAIVRFIVP